MSEDVDRLEQRINREREELSDTVAALAEKADVKARARARDAAESAGLRVRDAGRRYARPRYILPVAAAVAAVVAATIWRRRRR